jgi:hypothetical protein
MSDAPQPLLDVRGLQKFFPITKGFLQRTVGHVRAVDGVDFTVNEGETLGVVGESGCGKTTASRCILRAIDPTGGEIFYQTRDGRTVDLAALTPAEASVQVNQPVTVSVMVENASDLFAAPLTRDEIFEKGKFLLEPVVGVLDLFFLELFPFEFSEPGNHFFLGRLFPKSRFHFPESIIEGGNELEMLGLGLEGDHASAGGKRARDFACWGLCVGVGLTHHMTSVFVSLLLSALLLERALRARVLPVRLVLLGTLCAAAPLLAYAHVFWRAAHPAVGQWGTLGPDWDSVRAHLIGTQYRVYFGRFAPSPAQRELVALPGIGASPLEVSHRSPWFEGVIGEAEDNLRSLLGVPGSHHVLFCQGGASMQFSMVPMNLLRDAGGEAAYIVTGSWGSKALKEAEKEGAARAVWSGRDQGFVRVPRDDELGDVLDAAGRYPEAFGAYAACNEILRELHHRFAEGTSMLSYINSIIAAMRRVDAAKWAVPPAAAAETGGASGHVFLLGFPRSGTTLLEVALDGHPRVASLEEHELLKAGVLTYMREPVDFAPLLRADENELGVLRERYWQEVRATGIELAGKVFVDKHPLHSLKLPLIARLFPNAKILFAHRDPRDVVLSCFRRRFSLNPAMYQLLTLEGVAAFYDVTMRLAEQARPLLGLEWRVVRYEDLVEDLDLQLRAICEYIGLEWVPTLGDFASRAQARERATPSTAQLARGLDKSGVGHWRHYRSSMESILPTLDPWVLKTRPPAGSGATPPRFASSPSRKRSLLTAFAPPPIWVTSTSARTRSRKRCRRWTRPRICACGGISSAISSPTRRRRPGAST